MDTATEKYEAETKEERGEAEAGEERKMVMILSFKMYNFRKAMLEVRAAKETVEKVSYLVETFLLNIPWYRFSALIITKILNCS